MTTYTYCSADLLPTRAAKLLSLVVACWLTSCAGSGAVTESGKASYYADKFSGRNTASGVPYHPSKRTAAHNTLPFGTVVRVTNQQNGRSVKVTINDRGPHVKGRIIDLSKKAAHKIGVDKAGVAPVSVRVVRRGSGR